MEGDKNRSILEKDKFGDSVKARLLGEWRQSDQVQNDYKRESLKSLDPLILNPNSTSM